MGEIVMVGIMGAAGYGLGSFVDRFVATTKLDTTGTQGGPTETPAAGHVYNSLAIPQPMGLMRWSVGLGGPVVLLVASGFIGGKWTKAALQGVGYGWGIRTLGKGLDDMLGKLTGKGNFGARYYASEIAVDNAIKAALPTPTTQLPQAAVATLQGVPKYLGAPCPQCGVGAGTACGCESSCCPGGGSGGGGYPPSNPPMNNPPGNPPFYNPPQQNPPQGPPGQFAPPNTYVPGGPSTTSPPGQSLNTPGLIQNQQHGISGARTRFNRFNFANV